MILKASTVSELKEKLNSFPDNAIVGTYAIDFSSDDEDGPVELFCILDPETFNVLYLYNHYLLDAPNITTEWIITRDGKEIKMKKGKCQSKKEI